MDCIPAVNESTIFASHSPVHTPVVCVPWAGLTQSKPVSWLGLQVWTTGLDYRSAPLKPQSNGPCSPGGDHLPSWSLVPCHMPSTKTHTTLVPLLLLLMQTTSHLLKVNLTRHLCKDESNKNLRVSRVQSGLTRVLPFQSYHFCGISRVHLACGQESVTPCIFT